MTDIIYEKHKLTSFDKNYSATVYLKSPDKYRKLEEDSIKNNSLISRGAGYSYVATSFKKDSLSIGMKNFNRILHFDEKQKLITVESGISFIEFLNFTLQFGLWIPQIPGYPFISIGGAVASNIHGKSAATHGTIRNAIENILIFHKIHGWINLSNNENKNIFDLTVGGHGLTGTIVNITLKLVDFEGFNINTSVKKVSSIIETVDFIKNNKEKNDLVYSWNRIDTDFKNFGNGLIFCNKNDKTNKQNKNYLPRKIKPGKFNFFKNISPFCLWNKLSIKILGKLYLNYYNFFKGKVYKDNFNNVVFPFFGKEIYFSLFGKRGFIESQILIDYEKVELFIKSFKNLIDLYKPTITLFSIKGMSGEHKYLRFEGNMVCLTFDVVNNNKSLIFLNELDQIYIKFNVLPSIIKDSRIDKKVFDKCYKFADTFRKDLRNFDNKRHYKSEMSDRLGL